MSSYKQKIQTNVDYRDLQKGQVTEAFDSGAWQELKVRAQKVASSVSLQFLLEGKKKVITEGDLWSYKTTFIKDKKGNPKSKLVLYIQKIAGSNQMIGFEVNVPLKQDITRFCSRMPRNRTRQSGINNPVLLLVIGYSAFLNILQLLPQFGFMIDLGDPVIVAINAVALTSICWYAYLEIKMEGYWATFYEQDSTRMIIHLDIRESIAGKITQTIKVRRVLTVYRVEIFYSEVMHTEALEIDWKQLSKDINSQNKQKIEILEAEKLETESNLSQITTQLNQAHTALEGAEKRIRKARRDGFVERGTFEGEPIFEGVNTLNTLMESGAPKYAIAGIIALIAGYIFLPMLLELEFGGLPEISLFWQITVFLSFACILLFLFVTAFIKAQKIT